MLTDFSRRSLAAIALVSLIPGAVYGKQDLSDWKKVKRKVGSPVAVIDKTGQRLDGTLLEATDQSLKLSVQGRTEQMKKEEVAEVRVKKKGGGNKAAWVGGLAAAGFGIGAAIGKATNPLDDAGLGQFGPLIGGMIGGAAGALTGIVIADKKVKIVGEETIYKTAGGGTERQQHALAGLPCGDGDRRGHAGLAAADDRIAGGVSGDGLRRRFEQHVPRNCRRARTNG